MYAPWLLNCVTSPSTTLPGWCSATNSMNGSGWLAGSAVGASFSGSLGVSVPGGFAAGCAFFLRDRGFLAVGGGLFGTGFGPSSVPLEVGPECCAFFTAEPDAARVRLRVDARTAMRLRGPRTGVRSMNTQPTPGTGFPPTSRPSSKSHSYSPWNYWNES